MNGPLRPEGTRRFEFFGKGVGNVGDLPPQLKALFREALRNYEVRAPLDAIVNAVEIEL